MTNDIPIDESMEGKRVVTADGDDVGMVSGVRGQTVYVDADPGLTDKITAKLGWDDVKEDDYPLQTDTIERVTDDEIHLSRL